MSLNETAHAVTPQQQQQREKVWDALRKAAIAEATPSTSPAFSLVSNSSLSSPAYPYYAPSSVDSVSGPTMYRAVSCGSTASGASSIISMLSQSSGDSGYYTNGTKPLRSTGPSPLSQSLSTDSGYYSVGTKSRSSGGPSSLSQMSIDSGYYSSNSTPHIGSTIPQDHSDLLSGDIEQMPNIRNVSPDGCVGSSGDLPLNFVDPSLIQGNTSWNNAGAVVLDELAFMPEEIFYLPEQFYPMQPFLGSGALYNSFGDDNVRWFATPTNDSGYSSGGSSWASPASFMSAVQALHQAQAPTTPAPPTVAKKSKTSKRKNYVCPIVVCKRGFVRKSYYDSHLKSKHADYAVNVDKPVSGGYSAKSDTPEPATTPEGSLPIEPSPPSSPGILPAQPAIKTPNFRNLMGSHPVKQKTETVNEWLENVQNNENSATTLSKSGATCPDSQQSIAGVSTPRPTSLCRSSSGASDSAWFESEGEASFVLGDDATTSATPYEPESPTISATVLAQELVTRYLAQANTPTDGAESSSQTSSASSTSGQTHTTAIPSSVTSPPSSALKSVRKRPLEDDEGEGSRRSKFPRLTDGSPTDAGSKLLACPYAKFDPRRYSERNESEKNYRGCSSCYLRDIARLKQHLYRVHRRPEHHCPTCFASFDSTVPLHAHIVERTCQQQTSPFEEKMTPDQVTAIKRRGMGRSRSDSWNEIYKILFPDSPLPLNPYIDSVHAETLQDFMAYIERDGQHALVSEINQRMFGPVQASPEEQQFVDRVIAESVNVLIQRLEARFRREASEA